MSVSHLFVIEEREIILDRGRFELIQTSGGIQDGQRSQVQRFGFGVAPLRAIKLRQVV